MMVPYNKFVVLELGFIQWGHFLGAFSWGAVASAYSIRFST